MLTTSAIGPVRLCVVGLCAHGRAEYYGTGWRRAGDPAGWCWTAAYITWPCCGCSWARLPRGRDDATACAGPAAAGHHDGHVALCRRRKASTRSAMRWTGARLNRSSSPATTA
ncbi:MAG: hypothetical protein R2838_06880 [Caldilineaceae bacterium]